MLRKYCLAACAFSLSAAPAYAAQDKPLTDTDPSVIDAAKTPVTDLNLDKQEIPPILMDAQIRPYDTGATGTCRQLMDEVTRLDEVLGPDIDLPQEVRDRLTAGKAAKVVVGMFIPFRGLIREVSGANAHDRAIRAAIQAGMARRGFLKGVGISKHCLYPARPATKEVINRVLQEQEAEAAAEQEQKLREENRAASD